MFVVVNHADEVEEVALLPRFPGGRLQPHDINHSTQADAEQVCSSLNTDVFYYRNCSKFYD